MKPLIIHTDGSCLGNPGPGGWAAIIQDDKEDVVLSGNDNPTTNNRMEMLAIIRALQWMKALYKAERAAKLYTDSSLLVKSINLGWKRKSNVDLWAEFDTAYEGLDVEFFWVKGHAGNEYNEKCDQVALAEAEKAEKDGRKKSPRSEQPPQSQNSESSGGDSTEAPTFEELEHAQGYFCNNCHKASPGLLGYMEESDMIRVDCLHCGKYIKFAAQTPKNLARAKKRTLITKAQMKALQAQREADGEILSERQIKELKKMTQAEAQVMLESKQKLF